MNLEPEVVESSLGPPVGGAENVGQSTSESLEKRCSQCKQPLSSKREGRRHEELTGHVWQPMYVCKACGDAFKKDKLFRGHQCRHTTSTDVVESPKASSQASVQVRSDDLIAECHQVFCEQTPNLDHMERRCNQCKMPVSSRKKGRAHGQLTGHKSQPIYGCVVCGDAFRKETLYLEHQCSGQSVAHEPESHDTSDGLIGGVLGGTSVSLSWD
ncbi:hypothetical protein C8Q77DRAFT_1246350 [Trametes polyzona]|nr:hypothetical protein C8Q77DRAFT_1246350 [Trametes polyzona]